MQSAFISFNFSVEWQHSNTRVEERSFFYHGTALGGLVGLVGLVELVDVLTCRNIQQFFHVVDKIVVATFAAAASRLANARHGTNA